MVKELIPAIQSDREYGARILAGRGATPAMIDMMLSGGLDYWEDVQVIAEQRVKLTGAVPEKPKLRPGQHVIYNSAFGPIKAIFLGYEEGWCELRFCDRSVATVRPSRVEVA